MCSIDYFNDSKSCIKLTIKESGCWGLRLPRSGSGCQLQGLCQCVLVVITSAQNKCKTGCTHCILKSKGVAAANVNGMSFKRLLRCVYYFIINGTNVFVAALSAAVTATMSPVCINLVNTVRSQYLNRLTVDT